MSTVSFRLLIILLPLFSFGCRQQSTVSDLKLQTLVSTPDHIDAGDIRQYGEFDNYFVLHNNSGATVQITRLKTSCGCTIVRAEAAQIKPNETDRVTVALTPGGRVGPYQSLVTVCWQAANGGAANELKLRLTYNSVRLITTTPVNCNFGDVTADQPISLKIEINRGEDKLPWNNLSIAPSKIPAYSEQISTDRYAVTISFQPDKFPLGILKDNLTISLLENGNEATKLVIPVQLRLVSDVTAEPPTIYCGIINLHSSQEGSFKLKSSKAFDLKVISIESSDPEFIQAKCIQAMEGELDFQYSTSKSSSQGNHSGHFLLTIQSDKKRQILVPFVAYIN